MRPGKPIIYWDTCVFLAWLKNETRPNNEMDGVNYIAQEIHKDHAVLITSAMTKSEILNSTLDDVAQRLWINLFKRKNFQEVGSDSRVWTLTQEIRDYYQKLKDVDNLPTLTTPDAVHLASAIVYGASEFHTFDEKNIIKKRRALLPLNGNVAGYVLKICKPPLPPQSGLPF